MFCVKDFDDNAENSGQEDEESDRDTDILDDEEEDDDSAENRERFPSIVKLTSKDATAEKQRTPSGTYCHCH